MPCNMLGGLCSSATQPPVTCGMTVNAALHPNEQLLWKAPLVTCFCRPFPGVKRSLEMVLKILCFPNVNLGCVFQHVHVHILPRKVGDFERNDSVYDEVTRLL